MGPSLCYLKVIIKILILTSIFWRYKKKFDVQIFTALLNEKLTESEINYIVDALQLSNKVSFESQELFDRISYLTDPEINGHLTRELILELMNQNKINNLINMNDEDRYNYFISKISDFEIVWELFDNGWAVLQSAETGGTNVPFWSEKEFAQICATGLWHNYSPKEITLEDFVDKWIPGMKADGRNVCVFMIPDSNNKCIVVDPGTLKDDIEKELENY